MEEINAFTRLLETLHAQPVLTLFLILGMGYLMGNIRIGSFSLGPVAGVLFAGLFLGHFDFRMSAGAQAVGFALFIFSVGYQAGPRFFDVLRTDGLKYFSLAVVIATTGFIIAVIAAKILDLSPGTSAGLLSGGLTSSPTLAAAQEALRTGQVAPPEGITADAMIGNVATGYAITYIFGLAGLIAIIKLLPQVLGIDLEKEAKALEIEAESTAESPPTNVSARIYRVTDEALTRIPGKQLREQYWDKASVVRLKRGDDFLEPDPERFLQLGDELHILAPVEYFTETVSKLGEEITPKMGTAQFTETAQVVVINKDAVGKTLQELDIAGKYGVLLTGVSRMRMQIPNTAEFELRRGDILTVVGLLLFMAGVGLRAGGDIIETFMAAGPTLVLAGIMVTLTPILAGYFFGRKVLKIHPVLLFGGITG